MSGYSQIVWLAICGGLTAVGLVLSVIVGRRRGPAAGLRGVAWSLLPLAAFLTGTSKLLWRFGTAIGSFATSFIFSPLVWSGIAVAGLAAVLFVVSGSLRGRRAAKGKTAAQDRALGAGQPPGSALGAGKSGQPAGRSHGKAAAAADEDFADVADILRKHGIK